MALNLSAVFEKFGDQHLKFENLQEKYRASPHPDICAFLLLVKLAPPDEGSDMVVYADHDTIALQTDVGVLAEKATEEDIVALRQCGVIFREDDGCLIMFV